MGLLLVVNVGLLFEGAAVVRDTGDAMGVAVVGRDGLYGRFCELDSSLEDTITPTVMDIATTSPSSRSTIHRIRLFRFRWGVVRPGRSINDDWSEASGILLVSESSSDDRLAVWEGLGGVGSSTSVKS